MDDLQINMTKSNIFYSNEYFLLEKEEDSEEGIPFDDLLISSFTEMFPRI